MFGDVDGERGLTHRGAAGDDQQIAAPQATRFGIEVDEAGRQSARLVGIVVQIVDLIDQSRQRLLGADVSLAAARAFGDREDLALGVLDELARRLALFVPDRARDLSAHGDERTQQRALLDDLRIRACVGGAGRIARQCAEIGKTARIGQLAETLQMFGDGDRIAGLRLAGERRDAFENDLVIGAEEIIRDDDIADAIPRGAIEHQSAKHRLFGFDGVRRSA
jgi:hypothetical protein